MGYGYSTNSNFTPASGWTSTGTASASMSGSMSTSYSANSPYSISYNDDSGNWATISGTVTGSGSGRGGYNYNQTDSLASDGTWSMSSGSGGGSGGQGWTWGYSGSGSYSQASGGGALTVSNVEQTQGGVDQYGSSAYDPEDYLPSGVVAAIMSDWVDPQATPSPASVLDQTAPVSSLPSLATSASLVDAIWGMGSVAVAGYDGNNSAFATEYVVSMPQTLIAAGNNPLSLPTFTSETMPSAGGVFGRINVANMAPVTESSNIVGEGFRGVTAGTNVPNTGSKGPDPSTNPVTNVVKPTGGGCFAAGTLIPMADGTMKPIEQVEVGDRVKSASERDPEGPISSGGVAEVFRHQPQGLMEVGVDGSVIRCTGNHPFYVRGRGFIPAEQLKSGDELRAVSGGWSVVGAITANGTEEPVYNIRVAGLHTYFVRVGASEALVHNKGGDPSADANTPAIGSLIAPLGLAGVGSAAIVPLPLASPGQGAGVEPVSFITKAPKAALKKAIEKATEKGLKEAIKKDITRAYYYVAKALEKAGLSKYAQVHHIIVQAFFDSDKKLSPFLKKIGVLKDVPENIMSLATKKAAEAGLDVGEAALHGTRHIPEYREALKEIEKIKRDYEAGEYGAKGIKAGKAEEAAREAVEAVQAELRKGLNNGTIKLQRYDTKENREKWLRNAVGAIIGVALAAGMSQTEAEEVAMKNVERLVEQESYYREKNVIVRYGQAEYYAKDSNSSAARWAAFAVDFFNPIDDVVTLTDLAEDAVHAAPGIAAEVREQIHGVAELAKDGIQGYRDAKTKPNSLWQSGRRAGMYGDGRDRGVDEFLREPR